MGHRILITAATLVLALSIGTGIRADTKEQKFEKLATEALESLQSFYPVTATERGIHAFDHRLTDYSPKSVKKMIKKLDGYEKKLYKYRKTEFPIDVRIDYKLIKSNVDIALLDLKQIKWHKKSPQLYLDEAVNGIYLLMLSQHAPAPEKLYSIIARMKAVPTLFKTARQNIKNPPQVYVDLAIESLESAQRFYREVAGELMMRFPERADEILRVSTHAREAMNDFDVFLSEVELGPDTGFAIGKKNLDYKLKHEYFLDFDSDSLQRIGEALLAEAQEAYDDFRVNMETNHQNGQDSVFVPASFCRQDILDYYLWETRQVKQFLSIHNIITVPDDLAPVEVMETPPFLRSMVAGITYKPAGPFDEIQQGYFYVRPVPENLDSAQLEARYRYVHRRGFKGSVVHEVYPGHHLQLQLAGRHPDPVRKWQTNMMMIDGWASYCEEMMYRAGLYGKEDPAMQLAILNGIRYQAVHIIADVKLHTGQFTFEECIDWMVDVLKVETASAKNYHRKMVRKCTLMPTEWMSYLMGKREIELLRDAALSRGNAVSEKEFYNALLTEGSIPPALMWKIMGLER